MADHRKIVATNATIQDYLNFPDEEKKLSYKNGVIYEEEVDVSEPHEASSYAAAQYFHNTLSENHPLSYRALSGKGSSSNQD